MANLNRTFGWEPETAPTAYGAATLQAAYPPEEDQADRQEDTAFLKRRAILGEMGRNDQARETAYADADPRYVEGMGEAQKGLSRLGAERDRTNYEFASDGNPRYARSHPGDARDYEKARQFQGTVQPVENRGSALRQAFEGERIGSAGNPAVQPGPVPGGVRGAIMGGSVSGGTGPSSPSSTGPLTLTNADLQSEIDKERTLPASQRQYGPSIGLGSDDVVPGVRIEDILAGRVKLPELQRRRNELAAVAQGAKDRASWGVQGVPQDPNAAGYDQGISAYDRLIKQAGDADNMRLRESFPRASAQDSAQKIAQTRANAPKAFNRTSGLAALLRGVTNPLTGGPAAGYEKEFSDIIKDALAPSAATTGFPTSNQGLRLDEDGTEEAGADGIPPEKADRVRQLVEASGKSIDEVLAAMQAAGEI